MTFDASKLFSETPLEQRPIVGAVKVNKAFVKHDASFECAAWWEDYESELGVHPIYLGRSHQYPKHLNLNAYIKAKVVDDYFPALWCGVAISKEPYKPKRIGETRFIRHNLDIVEAIQRTGNSPGGDIDVFIHPSWWKAFTDEAEAELREDYRRLPEFWEEWNKLDPKAFHPRMQGQWNFDDEFRSRLGMIAHFGGLLEKWSRRIEKINWHSQYHKVGGRYDTEYQRTNFAKNTEWVDAGLSLQNLAINIP